MKQNTQKDAKNIGRMTKKMLGSRVSHILKEVYPDAECALNYKGDPWKLLIMARLSAQCTDARVNLVCETLFEKLPTMEAMANADISLIEELIHSCGLYRMKAKDLKEMSRQLIDNFGGQVPSDMDALLSLSGVYFFTLYIIQFLMNYVKGKEKMKPPRSCHSERSTKYEVEESNGDPSIG